MFVIISAKIMALESPVLGSLFASLLFPGFSVEIKLQVQSSPILLFAIFVLITRSQCCGYYAHLTIVHSTPAL